MVIIVIKEIFKFSDDALKKSANKIGSQNEKSAAEIEDRIFGRSNNRVNNYILFSFSQLVIIIINKC